MTREILKEKNSMKSLAQLIKDKKFDWVNNDIEKHFVATEVPEDTEYKLFQFDRNISSKDAVKEIEKEGWRPANISELLSWKDWKDEFVIALGSIAEVNGFHYVPCLSRGDSRWYLGLGWWDVGWAPVYRFLAVRHSSLSTSDTQKSEISSLESLTLRIEKLEEIIKSHNL